ncbi:MAG: TOBE domain-containing protein [Streptosporangiaceae bacterium]
MIRPTGIRLCPSHTGEHQLAGTVADVAFGGRGYEHAIDIAGHGRLTNVFADTRARRGDPVGLRLDAAGCHLFQAAAAGGDDGPEPASPGAAASQAPAVTAPGKR